MQRDLQGELYQSSPATRFQYLTVTFPASANTDLDIPHTLAPFNFDEVDYEIVRKDRACDVYNDQSGTRKAWTATTLYLRCSVASAVVQLRLSIRRT